MENELSIILKNDKAGIQKVRKGFDEFGQSHQLQQTVFLDAHLVLDEVLTNIVEYGYDDKKEHLIEVQIRLYENVLEIEIIDDSRPFNILETGDPDLEQSLEEKPIGGLGIYLVKKLMDELEYCRQDGRNHLVMKKKITVQVEKDDQDSQS